MQAWRGVEAQHIVATMRLVDTLDEQSVLERLLEGSKPPLPAGGGAEHYLLAVPCHGVGAGDRSDGAAMAG